MKKLLVLTALSLTVALASCSKSKEAKCKEMMNHMMDITMNNPQMKKMPKEMLSKMKEQAKKQMEKGIKECVKEFDEDAYKCMMKVSKLEDVDKCAPKKK